MKLPRSRTEDVFRVEKQSDESMLLISRRKSVAMVRNDGSGWYARNPRESHISHTFGEELYSDCSDALEAAEKVKDRLCTKCRIEKRFGNSILCIYCRDEGLKQTRHDPAKTDSHFGKAPRNKTPDEDEEVV